MDVSALCLIAGPVISGGVSLLKRVPFIGKYPKTVSFIVSAILGGVGAATGTVSGISEVTQCILIPFAGAVTTYEAVTKQVTKVVEVGKGSGDYEKDRI